MYKLLPIWCPIAVLTKNTVNLEPFGKVCNWTRCESKWIILDYDAFKENTLTQIKSRTTTIKFAKWEVSTMGEVTIWLGGGAQAPQFVLRLQ